MTAGRPSSAYDVVPKLGELRDSVLFGDVWERPELAKRDRSLITLAALVALGHDEELALHLRGARRNGLSVQEIAEALLQTAIYCGVPAANTAFRIAQRVFSEDD
jgi:3-oxoadipate enol-lactonase/4-carboxymuconolactone decarboxylase